MSDIEAGVEWLIEIADVEYSLLSTNKIEQVDLDRELEKLFADPASNLLNSLRKVKNDVNDAEGS